MGVSRAPLSARHVLSFAIDRERPLSRQIEEHVRDAITRGVLQPGSRLPSTRALAADLSVSRGVVVNAYQQLISEGYLQVRRGSAPVVAERAQARPASLTEADVPIAHARFNLRPDLPDLALFPRGDWLASAQSVLRGASNIDLAYGEPLGAAHLRNQLAPFLWRTRGVAAEPQRICVNVGSTQALFIMASVLRGRGVTRLGIEDPSHRWRRHTLTASGIEVVPIPVDGNGLRVDELAKADVGAVVVSPDHAYPLGVAMSDERRKALLDWAIGNDALVIEHDYDGFFRYDGRTRPALQGNAPEHVAYIGTASALLAPTVRIGWSVCPESMMDEVRERMAYNVFAHSRLAQLSFADAIERGFLDRHVRRARVTYKRRYQIARRALPSHSAPVGLYLHYALDRDADEAATLAELRSRGFALDGVAANAMGEHAPGIVVGFAAAPEPTLREALALLRRIARVDEALTA